MLLWNSLEPLLEDPTPPVLWDGPGLVSAPFVLLYLAKIDSKLYFDVPLDSSSLLMFVPLNLDVPLLLYLLSVPLVLLPLLVVKLEYLLDESALSLLRLEYLEVDSLLLSRLKLEYLLIGASVLSLQLPYLVVVSLSLLNASLQLALAVPFSNLEPPPSYLDEDVPFSNREVVPPPSVLAVLTGLLAYLGSEELESEDARLLLQPPEVTPYLPALE